MKSILFQFIRKIFRDRTSKPGENRFIWFGITLVLLCIRERERERERERSEYTRTNNRLPDKGSTWRHVFDAAYSSKIDLDLSLSVYFYSTRFIRNFIDRGGARRQVVCGWYMCIRDFLFYFIFFLHYFYSWNDTVSHFRTPYPFAPLADAGESRNVTMYLQKDQTKKWRKQPFMSVKVCFLFS